jgi:SAM-dependent methyltransferase
LFPNGGDALDVAGGVGRHAIWLAKRRWRVLLSDISDVGIAQARDNARRARVKIHCRVEDLTTADLGSNVYDLAVVFFYLERKIFPDLERALRPGGLLIYKTYTQEAPRRGGGPSHPMYLLAANELLKTFGRLQTLYYREPVTGKAVAEFVGRKR